MDTQHRLIEYAEMFRGTIDGASVYPRELVKEALRLNAAAVIVSHNHTSGNHDTSGADRKLTQRIKEALGRGAVRVMENVVGRKEEGRIGNGWGRKCRCGGGQGH